MAKKHARKSWSGVLRELMVAACWRMREESTKAEVVIVIVGTGGRQGKVMYEAGQSNPSAAYGVMCDAMAQMENDLGIEREDAEEPDEAGEE